MPFSEHDGAEHRLQFYEATKRADELMVHSNPHLSGLLTRATDYCPRATVGQGVALCVDWYRGLCCDKAMA